MQQQIPTIKIATKGQKYYINGSVDLLGLKQQQQNNNNQNDMVTEEMEEQWRQEERIHDNERCTSAAGNLDTEKQRWLQELPLRNPFSSLTEEIDDDPATKNTTKSTLQTTTNICREQVKIQTNTTESYRKVIKELREKNAIYHTYQLKTERSYKVIIRGLHPKTNTKKLSDELAKIGHQTRTINNMTRYDTKQPLPLFLIELELRSNNKDIFNIKKTLNTIVTVEPPRYKKDIPQCMRCQQYGHTKNYCNKSPACVKCTKNHLTIHCPYTRKIEEVRCYNCNGNHPASIFNIKKTLNTIVTVEPPRYKKDIPQCMRCQQYGHTKNYCNKSPACVKCTKNHLTIHCPYTRKIEEVRCYNCNGNHPASYEGCEIRKQLQRKLFPALRNRSVDNHQQRQSTTDNEATLKAQNEIKTINRNTDPKETEATRKQPKTLDKQHP
ncbi:uncharacterized protein LOC105681471 [Bombus impatiens]|uniref:Uncharacterized protein LOC105681471 n=1 Tax=Bombus impatiens TaxID=132113 RepID=A0A6P3V2I1_BOMIM|nr:uncharacterized protein LOC105681471 [Bombus impatiens]